MSATGQTEKNSVRAYVFRFAHKLGHRSTHSTCLKRAKALNRCAIARGGGRGAHQYGSTRGEMVSSVCILESITLDPRTSAKQAAMLHPRQRKELWDLCQREGRRLAACQNRRCNIRRKECQPKGLANDLWMQAICLGEHLARLISSISKRLRPCMGSNN